MATVSGLISEELIGWLEAEDPHAGFHVPLLRRAMALCQRQDTGAAEEVSAVAAKLERWRYQHLRERQGQWQERDWNLADLLDHLARLLKGRAHLPTRSAYQAIQDERCDPPSLEKALEALDSRVLLQAVCNRAREITEEYFAVPAGEGIPGSLGYLGPGAGNPEKAFSRMLASRQRRMFMYAPLYLSSYCVNYCAYCGFRFTEPIERKHLSIAEARREAEALVAQGFRHILLVTGDFPQLVSPQYLAEVASALCELGVHLGVEVAPLDTAGYELLVEAGVRSITLYQETYDLQLYQQYHPRGPKASFIWRLEGLDRAAEAGMTRLGLGVLLGLSDPKKEVVFLLRHAHYLNQRFPDRRLAFSLPRIHQAPADFVVPYPVDDETFIRLYCCLRIAFPTAELVLSTRERAELRDRLARVCITQMSAGSSTAPGGYAQKNEAAALGRQFPVHDSRSPEEVFRALEKAGFKLIWQID